MVGIVGSMNSQYLLPQEKLKLVISAPQVEHFIMGFIMRGSLESLTQLFAIDLQAGENRVK